MREICVIGGNRYFGKRLIDRLTAAGDRVTVINRGSSAPPAGTIHLIADRNDENSLEKALGSRTFDVVVDQVCYSPRQAEIARRAFAGRTRRYVMTSTVEVYEYEDAAAPVGEGAVDARTVAVDPGLPWDDTEFLDAHYGEGKRQAEAVFAAEPGLPYVAVRVAHVLGGDDDFTGRVQHYADRIRAGEPIAVPPVNHPATYIHVEEIADFLFWTVGEDFTGPVNAASHGTLTTEELCEAITAHLPDGRTLLRAVDVGEVSPFSFSRSYGMDNSRATRLGFSFGDARTWLPRAVAETLGKDD
ncbi:MULTISPECIES: NAD-dependent epimerase/dehydratase family protein [unclassified Streptomyces]|uniref:NAD-dependent epimerase/dehydratase family protein n=1 Tax=unclassified Streptomyces TaxID=2593676 RepID=UPI00224D6446|nr:MULTISPECIES: NAD-dependent epimerase/dehydratase family protein [unclassified Streptomyces]MCX4988345.1 NAD-dependent epimerase/dehydratase family protein [Streptomyces sp. NBC_00568]MCX5006450.1 NAD-dependent epimerase/dehydratase family protein [Streptomyces sp. NBC_00638]